MLQYIILYTVRQTLSSVKNTEIHENTQKEDTKHNGKKKKKLGTKRKGSRCLPNQTISETRNNEQYIPLRTYRYIYIHIYNLCLLHLENEPSKRL